MSELHHRSGQPVRVFVSYAQEDRSFLEQLERHLSTLERSGVIRIWHNGKLTPGETWESAVQEQLERADVT